MRVRVPPSLPDLISSHSIKVVRPSYTRLSDRLSQGAGSTPAGSTILERLETVDIDILREMLSDDILFITFTKKSGEKRVMKSTLIGDYLPETKGSNNLPSDRYITVWDLESNGWRSFKYDSIISVDSDYFNYVVES